MKVYRMRRMKINLWLLFLIFIINIPLVSCNKALDDEQASNESRVIESFISKNNWSYTKENGIYRVVHNTNFGYHAAEGDTIKFNFKAYTLDGLVFETNIKAEAKKAGLDTTVRSFEPLKTIAGRSSLIQGLKDGLLLLNENDSATIIFPSTKGYGDIAVGPVEPNSPIAFDIKLISVNNAQIEQEKSYISSLNLSAYGFVTDPISGLFYKFNPEGSGTELPAKKDTIYGWYKGTLINGAVIDEVETSNKMIVLSSKELLDGVLLGFLLTKKGGCTELYLPSYLGYGIKGFGVVKSYETIRYQLRLDSIKKQ